MSTYLNALRSQDKRTSYWQRHMVFMTGYAIIAALGIVYFSLARPDNFVIIGITTILAILPLFFVRAEYGVLALIIIRPIIDTFSNYTVISTDVISLNMNAVLGITVCVWGVIVIIREDIRISHIPGIGWVLALLATAALSILVSIDAFVSISELLRMASLFVFFVIGWHIMQRDNHFIVWVINALAISAVIPILLGGWQLISFSGLNFGGLSNRIYGTFGHPNVLGFYMVLVLGAVLTKYLAGSLRHKSLVYPWVLAGGLLALMFTYGRGAWIGLGIVLVTFGLMEYRKVLTYTVVGLIAVAMLWQGLNLVTAQLFNIYLTDIPVVSRLTTRNDEADSINWRLEVLNTMTPKVVAQPLLGYGIGNFVTLRNQGDIGLFEDPEAHNDYLRLAVEIGLVGLGLYLVWILHLFRRAWQLYASLPKNSWQKHYAIGLIGLLLAFFAMSVSDNVLQGTPVMWSFMLVIGALFGIKHPHRE